MKVIDVRGATLVVEPIGSEARMAPIARDAAGDHVSKDGNETA